jgi:hypothetical protein
MESDERLQEYQADLHAAAIPAVPDLYQTILVDGDDLASVRVERAARGGVERKRFGQDNFTRQDATGSANDESLRVFEHKCAIDAV